MRLTTSLSANTVQIELMDAPPPRAGKRTQLLGAHTEPVRHDLEKTPRSGGALVVHKKVLHRTAGYADDLRILPADVDHEKIVPPVQKARAARMAGDLRDALSGIRHGDAPYPVATQGHASGEKCAASSSARMLSAVSTLLQPVGRAESRAKDPSAASTAVFAQVEPISMPMA